MHPFLWEVIRYHRLGPVDLKPSSDWLSSRVHLYTLPRSNKALGLATFASYYPSLPDSRPSWQHHKSQTENRLKRKSTKVTQKLLLRSVHPHALSLWNFFCGAGGGGNLLWGAQNEVHCSHKIICLAPAWSSVCGFLKVWSERESGATELEIKVLLWKRCRLDEGLLHQSHI